MTQLRLGLVGCGKIGGVHAAAANELPQATLAAVCDADGTRAARFAETYGGRPFDNLDAMLDAGVDAIIVATPHPLHAEAAVRAAQRGVHVLVEKPLATTLADCDAMIAAAEVNGTTIGVVSQRRFYPPIARMRAAIDAGKIGRPALGLALMYSWRDEAYYRSDPWRGRWDTEGGGVLVNQSPHHLDILLWLMGEPAEVSGMWANLNHPMIEVEDTSLATIRFKSGALASIVVSLSQKPGLYSKIHIHGTNGASLGAETDTGPTFIAGQGGVNEPPLNDLWTVPGEETFLAQWQAEDRAAFALDHATTDFHRRQLDDFVNAIIAGRPPLATARDGRAVVELFTAIYRSNDEKRVIALPLSS